MKLIYIALELCRKIIWNPIPRIQIVLLPQCLLVTSLAGIMTSHLIQGYFDWSDRNSPSMDAILIAMVAFYLHLGVYPITFVLIPEIIPEKVLQELRILFINVLIIYSPK